MTRVPGLRKFTGEAKSMMGIAAWNLAENLAATLDPKPEAIAVGIRGVTLYSEVLEGIPGEEPARHKDSSDALHAYFTSVLEAESVTSVESTPPKEEIRDWKSADGRPLRAAFIRFTAEDGSEAEFRRADGKPYKIPLDSFDAPSQQMLQEMFEAGK